MDDSPPDLDQFREQLVVLAAQRGDEDAFRRLVDLFERRLLLAADEPIPLEEFRNYRMQLDAALKSAVVRERWTRCITLGLWAACFLSMAAAAALNASRGKTPEWYGAIHAVLVVVTLVETVSYFVRFRPALSRARAEMQVAVLHSIEQRLNELSRRLDENAQRSAEGER